MALKLHRRLRRFRGSEAGSMSVEAVMIFPILLWAYAAMFIFWDAFKAQNLNLKATYTMADMLSRQALPITPSFVAGMNDIYEFLIRTEDGTDIRVSVVSYVPDPDNPDADPTMELRWSEATGEYAAYTDMSALADRLPMMPAGDEMIIVESTMNWEPPISLAVDFVGLGARSFSNMVFTSHRFHNNTCWDSDENKECDDAETPAT